MDELMKYKADLDDGVVEFEIIKPDYLISYSDERLSDLEDEGALLDLIEEDIDKQITKLNSQIDNLTNKADGIDYAIAICCGVISGLVDIFFVGEFDFEGAKTSVDKAFEDFVNNRAKEIKIDDAIKKAKEKYNERGEKLTRKRIAEIKAGIEKNFKENPNLASSIETLEKKYKIPSDDLWKGKDVKISAQSHHLDDLAHHPSIIGLTASILTQFTKKGYFSNCNGGWFEFDVKEKELIGRDLKGRLFAGVVNWLGHLVSDMAGSNSSAKRGTLGMGLPGPFVSMLKEISMLPLIKETTLPKIANELFTNNNAIFKEFRLDLRSELAISKELTRQAVPVFLNQLLLRSAYFIRRFAINAKKASSIKDVPWKEVLPFGNRTIARMNTISLATMEVFDITDAAIRGAIEAEKAGAAGAAVGSVGGPIGAAAVSGVTSTAAFFKTFLLHVNYVGVGSFAVAGFVDTGMGFKREKLISERIAVVDKKISIEKARLYFKETEMWIVAEKAGESINEAYDMIEAAEKEIDDSVSVILRNIDQIGDHIEAAEEKNPGLKEQMLKTLKWGV